MTPVQQVATPFASVAEVQERLRSHAYLADRALATAIYLALSLGKPLLLEGEAGVGKTEVAKVLAAALDRRLIRLQCYEGIDASQALYEWNYSRQLIAVRAMQAGDAATHVDDLFGPEFLVERPLLAAIRAGVGAVLLVDELDRADDEFEAFLLEVLSEFAVTVPELGTGGAARAAGRGDHLEPYPRAARRAQAPVPVPLDRPPRPRARGRDHRRPGARGPRARWPARWPRPWPGSAALDVAKRPGVAEAIDWANALAFLGVDRLDGEAAEATLGAVLKDHDDLELARADLGRRGRGRGLTGRPRPCSTPTARSWIGWSDSAACYGPRALPVGTGRVLTFCRAATVLDPFDPVDLRLAARATLVSRPDDLARLDELFDRYFSAVPDLRLPAVGLTEEGRVRPVPVPREQADDEGGGLTAGRGAGGRRGGTGGRDGHPDRRQRRGHPAVEGLRRALRRRATLGRRAGPPACPVHPRRRSRRLRAAPAGRKFECARRCGGRCGPRASRFAGRGGSGGSAAAAGPDPGRDGVDGALQPATGRVRPRRAGPGGRWRRSASVPG